MNKIRVIECNYSLVKTSKKIIIVEMSSFLNLIRGEHYLVSDLLIKVLHKRRGLCSVGLLKI